MHALIRRLHLYSAFTLLAFVVMYFVTGYVLSHPRWFGKATETVATRAVGLEPFDLGGSPNEGAFARGLQDALATRGKAEPGRRQNDGSWQFVFFHPGHLTEVLVAPDLRSATVTEKRFGWQRVLIGFHRLHGYGGGAWYDAWAVVYDLASISMIVFAITGVCLWYWLSRHRWPGWVILAGGFILTTATIVYLSVLP
jgi:hypothetical protein